MHWICNQKSLPVVALNWLNEWRLHHVVHEFLDGVDVDMLGKVRRVKVPNVRVSKPSELSKIEPLLFGPKWSQGSSGTVRMGVSYDDLVHLSLEPLSALESRLKKHQTKLKSTNYLIVAGYEHGDLVVAVAFLPNIPQKETAKAYIRSKMIQVALASVSKRHINNQSNNTKELELVRKAEEIAEHDLNLCWQLFQICARDAGWDLDKTECSSEGYEISIEAR